MTEQTAPHSSCDDYTLAPPTTDPLALREATWSHPLPGSRRDYFVYTQPVVTPTSLLYRHKNIVYCHSLLNGNCAGPTRWADEAPGRTGKSGNIRKKTSSFRRAWSSLPYTAPALPSSRWTK